MVGIFSTHRDFCGFTSLFLNCIATNKVLLCNIFVRAQGLASNLDFCKSFALLTVHISMKYRIVVIFLDIGTNIRLLSLEYLHFYMIDRLIN